MPCGEPVYEQSPYCILHTELPDASDLRDTQHFKIKRDKNAKVREKMQNGDFNFERAILPEINVTCCEKIDKSLRFSDAIIKGDINIGAREIDGTLVFTKAIICGSVTFNHVKVYDVLFEDAEIGKDLNFKKAKIGRKERVEDDPGIAGGSARFVRVKVGRDASFDGVTIFKEVDFSQASIGRYVLFGSYLDDNVAQIRGNVIFDGATIGDSVKFSKRFIDNCPHFVGKAYSTDGYMDFGGAKISGNISFNRVKILGDVSFVRAKIKGLTAFRMADIEGALIFRKAEFAHMEAQEEACRRAKQTWEKLGDRKRADDYFYREMEAKRKQKNVLTKTLECIIQYGIGYGVHYEWLVAWWAVIAVIMGLALSIANSSTLQNFIFGFAATFVPGYGISSHFQSGLGSELIGCIGAIFSTFFWAAFILVFARKYMR